MSQTRQPATSASVASETDGSTAYVALLAAVVALGGLLFGYDTAVISGAIGFLQTRFDLDAGLKGWAASSALVGCIVGAACAGTLSDRWGRKKVLILSAVLFSVSAVGSAVPRNLTELVLARIVGGVGVGMASMMSPLYIAEVAPARIRGRLVSVNQFAIIFGMLVVYFVNARIAAAGNDAWNVEAGWRWMFASETLPAVLFFFLLLGVPESPRWLTQRGRIEEAQAVLRRVAGPRSAQAQITEIQQTLSLETGSLRQLLQPGLRIPLAIGFALAVLQQVTGINVVLYYAPEIFKTTGRVPTEAINATVLVGVVNLAFTVVAIWTVDRLGRKPLLALASLGMGVSLFLLGGAFELKMFAGWWVLGLVLAYVASFAVAMGPVVWVVMSEIFPTRIRGRAMSIATVSLWIACFGVSLTFPKLLEEMGGRTFFVYAGMCAVALVFVLGWLPETKGRSLEQIERQWLTRAVGKSRHGA